ncbi:aldo/keto reductase [Filimonas lacunae]|nr:aldo/keto reductase [Filimonas lacunae]
MLERTIPSSGEKIPVIGLGTWQTFDVSGQAELENCTKVLHAWDVHGGRLIDSSPMYGKAEAAIGTVTSNAPLRDNYFYATKVWTTGLQQGIQQMQQSFDRMGRKTVDLMQIHNLVDWKAHLPQLRKMKEEGTIRYIGITHYRDSSHKELANILNSEHDIDFVQFNYSLFNRHAEEYLLQTAMHNQVATLINRPFGEGSMLQTVQNKTLPPWAIEQDITTWPGFILKYIISHPAVTCVIPATNKSQHAASNALAGSDFIPNEAFRKKMVDYIKGI